MRKGEAYLPEQLLLDQLLAAPDLELQHGPAVHGLLHSRCRNGEGLVPDRLQSLLDHLYASLVVSGTADAQDLPPLVVQKTRMIIPQDSPHHVVIAYEQTARCKQGQSDLGADCEVAQ